MIFYLHATEHPKNLGLLRSSTGMEEGTLNDSSSHQSVSAPPLMMRISAGGHREPSPISLLSTNVLDSTTQQFKKGG